ncbi:MAG: hypothetical protein NXI03_09135 [Alphaproteobacteria bacterium]|uniref:hypothetical protein n=1 Tax=Alexandriicola marinus TaxID=2081710 RepID=UPI000FD85FCB|nr:hypothetical protein [Alexandriicola marinus]MBM1221919.1 hypothetical protein [Ponticoccus sp. SC6-9]MBM1226270.1 hypothetical protein [Ponticoccus sp. SC6-15]MBM1230866.1 hypothetical protein [Ponticoccus sp. SC6-38]MBM1235293.1 hypothetical protein [Ponticoccus sp. SC6-45]MBM1239888.1 hypothetical protein [Ponticoccus sp. SC6-49]MBM1244032.1 hypothetical protein [Ponticoccus sp. SC2-64]MBM1248817.1 hypothetical protein [Ponticoccus sp. SC6-42]MBM1253543.1 hypothetical protein [Pontico
MKRFVLAAGFAAVGLLGGAANALTLQLDSYTANIQTVNIGASPVAGTPNQVGATGFNVTDTTGDMGSFVAWCLDVSHLLMGTGDTQLYSVTDNPFSNSFGLTAVARDRIQLMFDANYDDVDFSNADQAAAFQMALWEAAYEDDSGVLDLMSGLFSASSNGSNGLAATYIANALSYTGDKLWNMTFLEVAGYGPDRGRDTGQNLVTVSAVPLPAAGLLLLTGLLGAGALSRRRANRA